MDGQISGSCVDQIFLEARTHNKWLDRPVSDDTLRALIDLTKMGPTTANSLPARFVFVRSPEAKRRLEPHLSEGNRAKTMSAPVCTIIAYDLEFYEHLPRLFPHEDARSWFAGKPSSFIKETVLRNSSLQGGYFILAARALGLDAGPMSGFDNDGVDREFFPDGRIKSNFLCNLGHGDASALFPRHPRFDFEEIAQIL